MTDIRTAFERIRDWSRKNVPDLRFNPPADPEALAQLREALPLPIPQDLQTYLRLSDGERWNSSGVIGNWRLMSIEEILRQWKFMQGLIAQGAFDKNIGAADDSPYIKNYWWNPAWIPVVTSGNGHFFCLDTDPPEPDRFGQVLLFLHDDPARYLVASSLGAWFERIARDLESGLYFHGVDEGDGTPLFNNEAFMWSSLEGKHIYDDIPGRRIVRNDDHRT
jgi:cell wall assembly regulator SMI1